MKLIFTLASLGSGGAERVVSLLANKFSNEPSGSLEKFYEISGQSFQQCEVEIVCLLFNDYYYKVNEKVRVTFLQNISSPKRENEAIVDKELLKAEGRINVVSNTMNIFKRMEWLRKHVKEEKPDVVIAFTEGVYCLTIAALAGTKTKIISSERNDPKFMSWERKLLKRMLLPYTDWLVVQTEYIRKQFSWRGLKQKTSVIVNPVRDDVFDNNQNSTAHLNSQRDTYQQLPTNRIISVARLFPQKNQIMMIEAFAKIAEKYPNWILVIYGEGPQRTILESLIDRLKLYERVILPGISRDIVQELRRSDIFVLSSNYEGMSNSMIEAVCSGLPVVSTKVSGTEELIKEGENGYVVPIGDVDAFANALDKLMGNDKRMRQFSMKSLEMAENFRIDNILKEWMNVISKITGN